MTIEEWLAEERERLKRFVRYWRDGQKKMGGEQFPEHLPPGDWDEQYLAFSQSEEPSHG